MQILVQEKQTINPEPAVRSSQQISNLKHFKVNKHVLKRCCRERMFFSFFLSYICYTTFYQVFSLCTNEGTDLQSTVSRVIKQLIKTFLFLCWLQSFLWIDPGHEEASLLKSMSLRSFVGFRVSHGNSFMTSSMAFRTKSTIASHGYIQVLW